MKYLVVLSLFVCGCITTKQIVREALTVEQITCALLAQTTDVEAIRATCGIAEILRPYLEKLVAGKAAAKKAGLKL